MSNFKTVANQKVVVVNKAVSNKENIYGIVNKEAAFEAMRELKPNTYILYSYMNMNQNEYKFALSPTDVINNTGMSKKTYDRAVAELIEKGYLVQTKEGSNVYSFYELPSQNVLCAKRTQGNKSCSQNDYTSQNDQSRVVKMTIQPSQNDYTSVVKMTREILQDNTINNTINNTEINSSSLAGKPVKEKEVELSREQKIKIINNMGRLSKDSAAFNEINWLYRSLGFTGKVSALSDKDLDTFCVALGIIKDKSLSDTGKYNKKQKDTVINMLSKKNNYDEIREATGIPKKDIYSIVKEYERKQNFDNDKLVKDAILEL